MAQTKMVEQDFLTSVVCECFPPKQFGGGLKLVFASGLCPGCLEEVIYGPGFTDL